jgi:succinate dehydrogenase / fumarate reductase cytochrome b subunit
MLGNLQFLVSDNAYNEYAHFLMSFGAILYVVEAILLLFLLTHAVIGVNIWLGKQRARGTAYLKFQSAGEPSRQTVSSRSMIVTGIILAAFLVLHLLSFKYGAYMEVTIDGVVMRDLAILMREKFQEPLYAFGYPAVVLLLAVHLRHGIWSAFQSLGAMRPSIAPLFYTIGGLLGLGIAIGYLVVPLAIYFNMV